MIKFQYKRELEQITQRILAQTCPIKATIQGYDRFIGEVLSHYTDTSYPVATIEGDSTERYYLQFKKPTLVHPTIQFLTGKVLKLTPAQAMYHNQDYFMSLLATVRLVKTVDGVTTVLSESKRKKICEIPLMVGSSIDEGQNDTQFRGYFIVRGAGKQLLFTEEIARNTILTKTVQTTTNKQVYQSYIFSQRGAYRYLNKLYITATKLAYTYQPLNIRFNPLILLYAGGYDAISLSARILPQSTSDMIRLDLIRLLELSPLAMAAEYKTLRTQLDATGMLTDEQLLARLQKSFAGYAFIHLSDAPGDALSNKLEYLVEMIKEAFWASQGLKPLSVIDHLSNKRVNTPDKLLVELFHYLANKQLTVFRQQVLKNYRKKNLNLLSLLKQQVITKGFIGPLLSGTWIGNKQNLTTSLDTSSHCGYAGNFNKIISPLTPNQPHIAARAIQIAFRGRIDACASGHGTIVGLVKSMTLGSVLSTHSPFDLRLLKDWLKETGYPVWVNNALVGRVADSAAFIDHIRTLRAKGVIHYTVSCSLYQDAIFLLTDAGRILRPLFTPVLKKYQLPAVAALSYAQLLQTGLVEFLDVDEEATRQVVTEYEAFYAAEQAYVEINDVMLHDTAAAAIPLINFNGPARITYGQKLFKQAIIPCVKSRLLPLYTRGHTAFYNEAPLLKTLVYDTAGGAALKQVGVNLSIAVMAIQGYNMDDGIVMKRSSIERGLYDALLVRTFAGQTSQRLDDPKLNNFVKIDQTVRDYKSPEAYTVLEQDGLPAVGATIRRGQAIIGRVKLIDYAEQTALYSKQQYADASTYFSDNQATVRQVLVTTSNDLKRLVKVVTTTQRTLGQGDKLSSRYAQKGTIGRILDDAVLPYSAVTGLTPDLFISPAAYPTRYTFGHILEMVLGKVASLTFHTYKFFYGMTELTAFQTILKEHGFREDGTEPFVNPKTGAVLHAPIFTGYSYYLRLQHLAKDKLHTRNTGPIQLLTRQATAGKKSAGGLRFGQMERDALIAHGTAGVCNQRLNIDTGQFLLCTRCNVLVDNMFQGKTICHNCDQTAYLKRVRLPYAFKLLVNQINALSIKVLLYTNV